MALGSWLCCGGMIEKRCVFWMDLGSNFSWHRWFLAVDVFMRLKMGKSRSQCCLKGINWLAFGCDLKPLKKNSVCFVTLYLLFSI
jgi:hypothetical protein